MDTAETAKGNRLFGWKSIPRKDQSNLMVQKKFAGLDDVYEDVDEYNTAMAIEVVGIR